MANGPDRDKGSYRHMLDLTCSSRFESIMNGLLDGSGAQLANPCLQRPCGREFEADWSEHELETYLTTYRHPTGIVINPEWWFPYKTNRNRRPRWDLLCHVLVNSRPGLLLCEAKGHIAELSEKNRKSSPNPNSPRSRANDYCVRLRLCEASLALSALGIGRFRLSADDHYQLSNRLAYLLKLAEEGMPTILMYLGWLQSPDWPADPFRDSCHWEQVVQDHLRGVAPNEFLGRSFSTHTGGSMCMLVRSLTVSSLGG